MDQPGSLTRRQSRTMDPVRSDRSQVPRQNGFMVIEHAVLNVVPGEEQHFEETYLRAQTIIRAMPGFRSLRLSRCIETPARYLLLVEWERLEDHTEGFRRSPQYEEWRQLLHHFYDPFPVFEHYEPLISG